MLWLGMHMEQDEAPIYCDLTADGGEMLRLLQVTVPLPDSLQRGAFFHGGDDMDLWKTWLQSDYAETLGPHLSAARHMAGMMQLRELVEADRTLDRRMVDDAARHSRTAGTELLGKVASAQHARQATKLLDLAPEGIHLATAFGVQAAVYHIGLPAAQIGYVFTEWKASAPEDPQPRTAERFVTENACVMKIVRKVLGDSFGEFANASCA